MGSAHKNAQPILHGYDNVAARVSFLKWNMSSKASEGGLTRCSRALQLASLSAFELDSLMCRQPAPSIDSLHGRWLGINKGVGAAVAGVTQDIKVFDISGNCPKGHNVAVYQVGIEELDCRGFEPKTNWLTGCEQTMGNFVVVEPCSSCAPVKLDYTQADNKALDPSRRLVDELVMIDSDMLLGKAYIKVGEHLMPVAFFVLVREESSACDSQGDL